MPVFEDLMAISHGKPLLDFFDTHMATNLLSVSKEVSREVLKHAARYPFQQSLFTINKKAELWLHWDGHDYLIPDHYRLTSTQIYTYKPVNGRIKKIPTDMWELRIEPINYSVTVDADDEELYHYQDEGEYITLYRREDVNSILQAYKDIYPRTREAKEIVAKQKAYAAEAAEWRRTHVFPLRGNVQPTNPWARKN
jgi:hypothetical protein